MVRSSRPAVAVTPGAADSQLPRRALLDQPDPWPWLAAGWQAVDICMLDRFSSAMASRGEPVETTRMFLDPAYAYERLAAAHSAGDAGLRALALALFEGYQLMTQRRQTLPHSALRH